MKLPPIIELQDVTKTYMTGDLAVEVLHGVSLRIERGEYVAIMGASGSGKSTLMNILGCLDRPTTGTYLFAGRDVSQLGRDDLAQLRRDAFGFVFQQYNLLAGATAAENVEVPAIYAGLPAAQRHARAAALLGALGLGDRTHHRPNQLSGGQQQRVSIARALMNGGQIVLADEPTGALDSHSGREVLNLLRELHGRGHTIILITHDPHVAEEADRRIEIADGVIVGDERLRAAGPAVSEPDGDRPTSTVTLRSAGEAEQRPEGEPGHGGPAQRGYPEESSATARLALLYDVGEAVKMAFRSLRANLFRTLLTLLGIIVGVGAVVAMLAIGDGASEEVLSRIRAMGTNLLLVRPGAPNTRGTVATLTRDDGKAIAGLPNVVNAVPELGGNVTLRYGGADFQTAATGTTPEYVTARDWPVVSGTFFVEEDVRRHAPVLALGQTAARALFPDGEDPVGRYVLVNNVPFQVVGLMGAKGATAWGSDMDDIVFVPLTTGSLRLFGQRHLRSITVQVDDAAEMASTQQAIEALLLARHRVVDFQIRNMASVLETAAQTQNTLTILLGSIAAISLLVGGIGVMNIMLVSVTERTREIGIRMATGARTVHILLQFITEALVVCAIGGILGVLGGLAVAWTAQRFGTAVLFSLPPVLLAFGSAFFIGLLFGFMPARKAARLDPVVALAAE